jgi:hypothetical protein
MGCLFKSEKGDAGKEMREDSFSIKQSLLCSFLVPNEPTEHFVNVDHMFINGFPLEDRKISQPVS